MEMRKDLGVVIRYQLPARWMSYDVIAVVPYLVEAKASVQALVATPFQRSWVEKLQEVQLKMEVAGTSRIEGAEFSEGEFEEAVSLEKSTNEMLTRSQRQARCAMETYRWIAGLPEDRPIDTGLVREIHARLVRGCDDDHCPPGVLRRKDENVTFGLPRHRGCEGGKPCEEALSALVRAAGREFREHDLLVQALAFHYHFAAMHPFLDGNGRTARALEALMLQRAGLRDSAFIAMSNYYYEEKPAYLSALSEVRARGHDLTSFLILGLKGVALQCNRLFAEIKKNMQKALFRNTMFDLFNRLESTRKSVLGTRQVDILKILLEEESMEWSKLRKQLAPKYQGLKSPVKAMARDMNSLIALGAIDASPGPDTKLRIRILLDWPSRITESDFFTKISDMPNRKSFIQF